MITFPKLRRFLLGLGTTTSDPSTPTKATGAAKDGARAAMSVVRGYARQVRGNLGFSDANKVVLGLRLPDPSKTPVAAPRTAAAG